MQHKGGLSILGHMQKLDVALLGEVIGSVHSHLATIGFKIPLQATNYLTISLEPIVAPPQKFYHIYCRLWSNNYSQKIQRI